MTKEAPKKHNHLSIFTRHLLLTRGVGLLSAFSLISSGMVGAQNQPVDNSFSIPSTPTSPAPAPAPRKVAPPPAPRRVAPAPVAPRVSTPAPVPRRVAPPPAPRRVAPAPVAPRVSTPAPAPRRVAPPPAPRRIAPAPVAPRVSTPAPAPRKVAPASATVAAPTAPTLSAPEISIKKPTISVTETPRQSVVSPPTVSVPNPRRSSPPQVVIPAEIDSPPLVNSNPNPTAANPRVSGKNSYIDSQNYGGGSRNNNQTLPAVVLTERNTGCKTVSHNGQLAQASCNISAKRPQAAPRNVTTPRNVNRNRGVLSAQRARPVNYRPVNYARKQGKAPARLSNSNYKSFKLGSVNSVSPASTKTYTGYNNYYAKIGRPVYASNENTGLLFPLSIPATITSAFGWRVHPISGNHRMHTGTDIAAPTGTPVLASFVGRVAHADYMGGYGLTVVVRHTEEGNQESRYAHLSQIFVQPGDVVQQGEIIGLVGSTGNSTGPHLHFEWRHLMPSGWVPVDAGLHLEYAMHDLVNSLQAAQLNPISQK